MQTPGSQAHYDALLGLIYSKLRLAPSLVEAWVREAGLAALHRSDLRGMVRLVGRR